MTGGLADAIEAKLRTIPAMSGTATKLLTLLKNPNTNATQIEAVVRYDPGLTANILKLANSAYFGCTSASPERLGPYDRPLSAWDGNRSSNWLLRPQSAQSWRNLCWAMTFSVASCGDMPSQ